jgi:hypothetical protein
MKAQFVTVPSIVYDVVTENQQKIKNDLQYRLSLLQGNAFTLPRLTNLLSYSEFNTLFRFLPERNVNFEELQMEIDRLVKQNREDLPIE